MSFFAMKVLAYMFYAVAAYGVLSLTYRIAFAGASRHAPAFRQYSYCVVWATFAAGVILPVSGADATNYAKAFSVFVLTLYSATTGVHDGRRRHESEHSVLDGVQGVKLYLTPETVKQLDRLWHTEREAFDRSTALQSTTVQYGMRSAAVEALVEAAHRATDQTDERAEA
jgi:hypothetical protein